MSGTMRVFVNASAVDLPTGSDVAQAVRAADPSLLEKVVTGAAYVTDGRGIEIGTDSPLVSGAILRVVVRAKGRVPDADA